MIVGCLSIFECAPTLGRTLKSIEPLVDRIIVVDGAFEGFGNHTCSEDGTMAIVKEFPKPYLLIGNNADCGWRNQMVKRSRYLLPPWHMRDGKVTTDWIFMIDGDEYISRGAEETRKRLIVAPEPYYNAMFWVPDLSKKNSYMKEGPRLRFFRYVPGMKYVDNHHTIQYPDGHKITGWDTKNAKTMPLTIVHDSRGLSDSYIFAKRRYYEEVMPKVEKR